MFKPSFLSVALMAASSAVPAVAQSRTAASNGSDAQTALETLVIVSSRTPTPLRQVGSSVSILDKEDLKALGTPSLVDALRTLPSVSVSNSGGMGKATSLSIRGEEGYRTLVRVDGVDVSDPTGTQASGQVQHLLNAQVARVEVLRGPQGLMYGADAGGVINITTDHVSQGVQGGVNAEAGRYNSQQYSGYLGGGNETGDFYLSAARAETDGFNTHMEDTSGEKDGYENTTLHARGGLNIRDNLRADLVVRDVDARNEFDRCFSGGYIDDCVGFFDQTNVRGSLTHRNTRGENTLSYSRTEVSRTNYAAGDVSYDTEGEIARLEFNGHTRLSDVHTLVYGLEHREDTVGVLERDQDGVYLEYQGDYASRLYVTAGVRYDDNEDFGDNTSYRVSAAYLFPGVGNGNLKLKSSVGTGFRAPSLYEIDYNCTSAMPEVLSPLSPEESRGVDVGIEYLGNNGLHLEAVLFDQTIDDEIYFDLVNYAGYMQGEQSSESQGVELIAQWPLADTWALTTNYTYVDTEADDGNPRSRRPKHLANIGVRFTPTADWLASLDWRVARDRYDGLTRLENYHVLNANVRYHWSESVVVYVRGENILDEDYVEVPNYYTAGAAGYAGVEFTF